MNEKARNILKLFGHVALATVFVALASPGLLAVPGVCPSEACTIWYTLGLLLISPYYLAVAGFVLCFLPQYEKARRYVFRAIVLIPAVTAGIFWIFILGSGGG